MPLWLPDEPDYWAYDTPPSEITECQLGISPRCTHEAGYQWGDQFCCAHCLSAAEKAMEPEPALPAEAERRR